MSSKTKMEPLNSQKCLLFLQVILFQLPLSFQLQRGNETDRLSLLAFKAQITGDPLGRLSSWNESIHFCEWSGVACGRRHQRVVELDLRDSKLVGSLAPHIGNLSFLRSMHLENNSLSNSIPPEIGHLFRLQKLGLMRNMFSGEIPVNISRCSNLLALGLSLNNLIGYLPAELGSLSRLGFLFFDRNNLTGEIPASFGNLSSLESIYGTRNNLQGGIPESFGQLKKLANMSFGENNLVGMIPPSTYNLSSLTHFSVAVNQLHGTLPPDLCQTLPNLKMFIIHTNQFSGLIPPSISNLSELLVLSVSRNKFTGKVPTLARLHNLQHLSIDKNFLGNGEDDDLNFLYSLANNTGLQILVISDNNLGGVLPEVIANFSELMKMGFGRNQIRGSIPNEIGNLVNLVALGLETNQLTGIIPSSIGKLRNLGALFLNGNNISGSIPSSIGNMTSLVDVNLRLNKLQGSIPSSLGNCQNILSLALSQNHLTGPIPLEVMRISSLAKYLVLSENDLTGSLPLDVGQLHNLGYLDVSYNKLSGEIPTTLGSCISLEGLHLEGNRFEGNIPEPLNSLRAIQDLNLSHNCLTGQIPMFLGDFRLLENLDLSYNDLEGEVPVRGVFENASAVSVVGNKKLCGGPPQFNLPRCILRDSTNRNSSMKLKLLKGIIPGTLGAILMAFILLFLYIHLRKHKPSSGSSFSINIQQVTYGDLVKATNGFSSDNLIGTGSSGSVYRGSLEPHETVTEVAVKVIDLLKRGASKSFMAECEALKNIRHRNIVRILTACSSIDFQGNDFKALVFQYMVNGSLEEWLHPTEKLDEQQEPRYLNCIQRLSIAIDVASALDYLHHGCPRPIVHGDLKPSNVLLDSNMTALVGDFGLARFLQETPNQFISNQSSSIGIKGTMGYAAPEYGMGSQLTANGDLYSYGILLLEMFTGKRPTDDMFKEGLNLHNFAKMALPDRVMEVVDPIVLKEDEEPSIDVSNNMSGHNISECMAAAIKVGVACSEDSPRERMEIGSAVAELQRIRNSLLGIGGHRQHEIGASD